MRLQGEEPVEAVVAERPDGLHQLAVTRASHHDRAVSEQRILDLQLHDVRSKQAVTLGERSHANLNEVGRVPRQTWTKLAGSHASLRFGQSTEVTISRQRCGMSP